MNHRLTVHLFILTLGMPLLVAEAQQPVESTETAPQVATPVAVENVVDDQAIQRRLRRILETRERFSKVEVKVDSGVVAFSGTAETDEDRNWAETLAERTEGVVVVDNQIEVESTIDLGGSWDVMNSSLMTLWRDFIKRVPLLFAACVVLFVTAVSAKFIAKLITRLLSKRERMRSSLKDLINQLVTIGIWVVGLIIAAVVVFPGMTPAKALTVLGLGSVAIGFAFKDIFENFFAGILILWRYPFDRGDFISCEGITGRVQEITVRNTLIRRLDGELTVVPNAHLFKSSVDVLNDRASRRVRIICGVAYSESVPSARKVIIDAVHSCKSVKTQREPEVFAKEFAESSINFEVSWWTEPTPTEVRASRDEVIEAIKRELDAANIEIPFPYRTIQFQDPSLTERFAEA